MKQEEKILALRDAIEEANTKETYGLYKINNVVVEAKDLDTLTEALDILEAGFNLKNFLLTKGQKLLLEAYEIDIEAGKTIKAHDLEKKQTLKKGY